MTSILAASRPDGPPAPSGWIIDGTTYRHPAARFWAALLSDVRNEYPAANRIVLSALSPHRLDPDGLYPEQALQRVFDQWLAGAPHATLQETIDELALLGPPAHVSISILEDAGALHSGQLPPGIVDEEVFLYLAAWLLEWCGIPPFLWNNERVSGGFTAADEDGGIGRPLRIGVVTLPVGEGLMRRSVTLEYQTGSATTT